MANIRTYCAWLMQNCIMVRRGCFKAEVMWLPNSSNRRREMQATSDGGRADVEQQFRSRMSGWLHVHVLAAIKGGWGGRLSRGCVQHARSPCSLTEGSSSSWPTGAGQGNSDNSLISNRGGGGGGGGKQEEVRREKKGATEWEDSRWAWNRINLWKFCKEGGDD